MRRGRLSSGVIDTHCHLTFPEFASRVPEVMAEARAADVRGCITIATTTRDSMTALEVARGNEGVWCSAGVHPLYADQGPHDWSVLERCGRDPRCVAWGELGLDHHYSRPDRGLQEEVLEEQLGVIGRLRGAGLEKPIVLHCREAFGRLIPILRASGAAPERMVFHCFTGTESDMRACLEFGAMVSFTGVVTYPNAPEVRAAARLVPRDRIMVETDAPFLSPVPHRGKRPCLPAWAAVTARALAELRGETWDDFHEAINTNTARFFGVRA